MSGYFTIEDNTTLIFYQMPKVLVHADTYKKMKDGSKLLYVVCLDLVKLSIENKWIDKEGKVYIKLSLESIKILMGCSNDKAVGLKKDLVAFGLLEEVRLGQGKANRMYLKKLQYTDADVAKVNDKIKAAVEKSENRITENNNPEIQKSENQISKNPKIGEQEIRKSDTINNNFINTHSIDLKDDDDKRKSLTEAEESLITFLRQETIEELNGRSFNTVVRKVVDKHRQGKIGKGKFRDYLVTSLVNKIEALELRRMKDKANEVIKESKHRRWEQKKDEWNESSIATPPVFYNWLEE